MAEAGAPQQARQFAVRVVRRLRESGYQALWAGGCVRDQLLGRQPVDYDVATNATPDQIRQCFGRRRTLAIGASFGVITVRGRRHEGQIEVATFRRDVGYSDGRHPDRVEFSDARQDALRRDFTINGLFYDPLDEQVIDYVGGQRDLEAGIVRAIGDPHERIEEDKLRMLRAARFSATFGFRLDPVTAAAVQQRADQLSVVSPERIAAELRRMLPQESRVRAVTLLHDLRLLEVILPESKPLFAHSEQPPGPATDGWPVTLAILSALPSTTFRTALAGWLWVLHQTQPQPAELVEQIGRRWRLANPEWKGAAWLLAHEQLARTAHQRSWPRVQPVLVDSRVSELLTLAEAVARAHGEPLEGLAFCRDKLRLEPEQLNPPPLLTGTDLLDAGLTPGPAFQSILAAVRDRQLLSELGSRDEALELALRLWREQE